MRAALLVCCFIFFLSCQNEKNKTQKPSFLIGHWMRLDDKPENKTFETWNSNFKGLSYTKQGTKTNIKEILSIVSINDTLHLTVERANEEPTLFKFIQQTATSFVCVNAENEFPKKIKYSLEDEQLKAIISADAFRIDFVFEKLPLLQ
ncbi:MULTISPECIES: hypothetical protein [unclassified Polaribacter]|uniref:hypothetical protein n=1 Tax=unclassified Polaribacter TaxID=196858 RepID=UPI0011BFC0D1|nr:MULTISPECIES: hypothetical protein [unclassified Polaribacter]TXD53970.1 hypothetical protein ES043_02790 [Polaribacter sp. IC063]TXD59679.1 hypothetical protein ES044_09505 [Polaribacter sp. IC066]